MDLSIIIVNYKSRDYLKKCLESIKRSATKVSYEVIVTDNDKNNVGLAKGVNKGINKAKGKYILLLNPDTKVREGSIDALYDFAQKNPDAGAVCPKLLDPDGTTQNSVYHFPSIFSAVREYWFGEHGVYEKYAPVGNGPVAVDAGVMAAFLITPQALKKVGMLNEKYFLYFEDIDYCREIKKRGLKTYYFPKAEVIHQHGVSGKSLADVENQWRRLIPSSKIYHGVFMHYLINSVLWSGQKLGGLIPIILISLLTIPSVASMLRPGYFVMHDDLQAFRVYEMNKCLTDFQIPCRWIPDAGYQYGYPQFNFYPPLPYYLGSVMHLAGIQYIDVVKILFILGYFLSAITMYILVNGILKDRWAGFVAALVYTYVPYKALDVYVRGDLSEFWAMMFFPLILWSIYKLTESGKIKYLVWMSLSIFLLMTTHILMTMIFVPVALLWALWWLVQNKWKNFTKVFFGGLLGFGLSAFFILPVLFERQFVHTEGILSGYFDYRQHFVNLYKLFISREWGYGSSGFPNEIFNLSLGIVQWVVGLVVAPAVAVLGFRKNKKLSLLVLGLFIVTLGSIFMIHMKSSFIWSRIPLLWYMQFPWRFLAISIFLLSILTGMAIYLMGKYKYVLGIIFVTVSLALTFSYFVPKAWLNITDAEKFSGDSWEKQLTISIFDYLPIYATLPPWQKAPDLPEVLQGNVKFSDYKKDSDFQTGKIYASRDSLIRMPLFDFPGMTVKIDGKVIPHVHDNCTGERYCLGLITFNIASGQHSIDVRLSDTPVRRIGNILSLFGFGIVIYLLFSPLRNEKSTSK